MPTLLLTLPLTLTPPPLDLEPRAFAAFASLTVKYSDKSGLKNEKQRLTLYTLPIDFSPFCQKIDV